MSAKPFVRESTGLVKEIGALDAFSMNFSYLGPAAGITYPLIFAPYLAGADWTLATALGALVMAPVVLMYFYLSRLIPRSAGDYIYVSRILGARWGMIQAIATIFVFTTGTAVLAQSELPLVVSPALQALGVSLHDPSLISLGNAFGYQNFTSPLFFVVTLAIIALSTLVVVSRTSWFARIISGMTILQLVSTLVMLIAVFSIGGQAGYERLFNSLSSEFGGPSYSSLSGTTAQTHFDLTSTLVLMATIMGFFYLYNNAPIYFAGEVKRPERGLKAGLLYSYLVASALGTLLAFQLQHYIGEAFYDYTSVNGWSSSSGGIPIAPTSLLSYVSLIFLNSPALLFIVVLGSLTWYVLYCIIDIAIPSRILFAMAFDGLAPRSFARVSPKLHSPYVSALVIAAITAFFDYAEIYLGFSTNGIVQYGINFMLWAYLLAAISAIVIAKREIISLSSGSKKLFATLGAISCVVLLSASGLLITYGIATYSSQGFGSALFSGNLVVNLSTIAAIPIVALALYEVIRRVRAAQGIRVELAFREIPPE
jgi:amino acid transporter